MRLKSFILWSLTGCYWVVLFTMTHLPPHRMAGGPGGDKLQHCLAYFVLALLLGAALWHSMAARWRAAPLLALAAAAVFGALDELTQPLVGRYCELFDWLADVAGAAAACGALYLVQFVSTRRPGRADGPGRAATVESA